VKLRALRDAVGMTQLSVEAEAELGSGYLQRIESGKVAQPGRAMLERVLEAIGARYSERREVLEQFGYAVSTPVPNAAEIEWARTFCQPELDAAPFPAYALDCSHRLIAWNRQVPRLFGLPGGDPTLGRLAGRSILEAWFDPATPLPRLVDEPDIFLPAMIRAFRSEMQPYLAEPWAGAVFDGLLALPRFRECWERIEHEVVPLSPARALVPVKLKVPGSGPMQFRLSAEHLVRDSRFRLIYFFPSDLATMQRCAVWAAEAR
jgi:transcriptional regulator with XRE-family HTH domain